MSKYTINESSFLPEEVKVMGSINFEGNIIPMEWFSHLKLDNGKPDTISILILSDIAYWYRPTIIRDELSGRIIGSKKKFKSDLLQRSYGDFENLLGFSEKQTREALIRLEKRNILERVFRHINVGGQKIPNVMFIKINPYTISEITNKHDNTSLEGTISFPAGNHTLPSKESYGSSQVNTNTETTTKITTNNSLSLLSNVDNIKDNNSSSKTKERERDNKMLKIWNEIIEFKNEDHKKLTLKREKLLNLRLKEFFNCDISLWKDFCKKIVSSKFLMGEVTNFRIQLDWVLEEDNMIKVLENSYKVGDRTITENKDSNLIEQELMDELQRSDTPEFWQQMMLTLMKEKGVPTFRSWFKKNLYNNFKDGVLEIKAFSKFEADWQTQHFFDDIFKACKKTIANFKELKIIY